MVKSLQIILMGWEWDRLVYGLRKRPASKVIFVSSDPDIVPNKKWSEATTSLVEKLAEQIRPLVESEVVFANYQNFEDCLEKAIQILEDNVGKFDEINVNLSTGNTILRTAFILASQYYPINLFYVLPEKYNAPGMIMTSGAKALIELPTFELKELVLPTKTQKEVFRLLSKEPLSFTMLVKKFAAEKGLRLSEGRLKDLKSKFFYHLKKLKAKKLVKMEVNAKQLFIQLSPTGIFIHKILEKHALKEMPKQTKLKLRKKKG
jgi:hypothetical protein